MGNPGLTLNDPSTSLSTDPSYFDFPQPLSLSCRFSSGTSISAFAQSSCDSARWFKRGDNHLHVYRAQRLLNCYIGGQLGPLWMKSGGQRWLPLPENGYLDQDTEAALSEFQRSWGLPDTGCLCQRTRAVLPPRTRFHGWLYLHKPKFVSPFWHQGSRGPSSSSPNTVQPNKTQTKPANPISPATPPPAAGKKKEDDDEPWKFQFSASGGVGASGPLWTGKSFSGSHVKPEALEVDQKTEFDLTLPTSLSLGQGRLKLSLQGEYDVPLDNDHRGKPTVSGTLQVQADDFLKFGDWGSLSPFIEGYRQEQKDGDNWKGAWGVKGGAELDINITKSMKITADVNSGVQFPDHGKDPDNTAKVVMPLEGNLKFQVDLP